MNFYVRDPLPQFDNDHTAYPDRHEAMKVAATRSPTTYVSQLPPPEPS